MNQLQEAMLTAIKRSPGMDSRVDEFTMEYKTFKEENGIRKALPEAMKQKAVNLIKNGIKRSALAEKLGISQSAIIAWQKDIDGSSATVRKSAKAVSNGKPVPTIHVAPSSASTEHYTVEVEGVKLSGPKLKVRAFLHKYFE